MIHVGIVSRTATYWPLYLLAREGVVDLVELGSTAAGVDALLDHRVDVAATCPDVLIARGAPLRIAAGLVDRPPAWLVARAGVPSVAELRGRRVATTAAQGSVSIFLRAFLRAHGLARGDYAEVVVGPTPLQALALERGEVDAAMLTAPIDERLVARGFRRLAHVGDALGPCAFTTVNVRAGWTSSDPWVPLRDAFAGAIARLRDDDGRARELAVLAEETASAPAAPPRVTYDARVDASALERLLGFLRAEGVATSDARAYVEG
ncbi:MAG TPA: ABC transporter substrate-binding protein [Candidatus Limnocylindria bacterium]